MSVPIVTEVKVDWFCNTGSNWIEFGVIVIVPDPSWVWIESELKVNRVLSSVSAIWTCSSVIVVVFVEPPPLVPFNVISVSGPDSLNIPPLIMDCVVFPERCRLCGLDWGYAASSFQMLLTSARSRRATLALAPLFMLSRLGLWHLPGSELRLWGCFLCGLD